MVRRHLLSLLLGLVLVPGTSLFIGLVEPHSSALASSPAEDVLKTLRREHPRLYMSDSELVHIKTSIELDPDAARWHKHLQDKVRKMLLEPPAEHKLSGGLLLRQSWAALGRISTLAFLYRLDGDQQKAARARKEMLAVASFPDWNTSHFLDTAEMTHAMAIGYDWLFHYLSPEDRVTVRAAIVEKGLKPGLAAFNERAWWTDTYINWNQVCNGGLTAGALAIAEEEPDLAREIINRSRASIVFAMRTFAPDGGWVEGPNYWNYATSYNASYLAALESALGTDFGLRQMPGFRETGLFRMHSVGPLGLSFNFADAGARAGSAAQMFWLARQFGRSCFAQHERHLASDDPDVFHLIWLPGTRALAPQPPPALDSFFRGANVAFFRSDWNDPSAVFVGFKGGDNDANHAHLDLGTFVLDALGERWALDLGWDDYSLPGYMRGLRWTYYRVRTEGHNTLTLDGENQDPAAKAPLLAFLSTPDRALAVADLTAAYGPKVKQAWRGVALLGRRQVLVQDEIEVPTPAEIVWNFHTRAQVSVQPSGALLTLGKAQLEASILSPPGARFEVVSANPPPPQGQQPDVRNLIIRLPSKTGVVRIVVLLASGGAAAKPEIEPLAAWIAAGKLSN